MGRDLTERERAALTFLVDHAVPFAGDPPVPDDTRRRLRDQIPTTRAGARCSCGTCPSIELQDAAGVTPVGGSRRVLTAEGPGASLLLFIDDDRLSYLELAPHGDDVVAEFPPVEALTV
ncbi:hypothetical protein ABXJ56_08280 [Microbacterium chocolatum]|uniref:hypothetical protein n=1 Tax=Microbacterium aurantiacum TaxID=162393 RepID=UPI003390319A